MHRREKYVVQKLFVSVAVALVSLCTTFILLYIFRPPHQEPPIVPNGISVPASVVHDAVLPSAISLPVQVKIASINIVAHVNPVGVTQSGDMDIEENPEQAAWYKLGPKPGEEGSAVIAGHYGWKNGVPSVFNDLHKLVKGDMITTVGEDGQEKTFVVTRLEVYAPEQDATNVFRSDDGKAHLNLVTCQGSWNNSAQTYSERLVVFTDYVK